MSKRTFKVVFFFVAALSIAVPGMGQETKGTPFRNRPAFDLGDLSHELKLTPAQQAADAPLIENEKAQAAALWEETSRRIKGVLDTKELAGERPIGVAHSGTKNQTPQSGQFGPSLGFGKEQSVRSPQWGGYQLDYLTRTLKLTKDQQGKIRPMLLDLQRRLLDLHEKTAAQISNGLDREQRDKFKSLADKYDPPFYNSEGATSQRNTPEFTTPTPAGVANSVGGPALDVLTKELKLTAAQQAAIDPFVENEKSQSAALWQKAGAQIESVLSLKETGRGVAFFLPNVNGAAKFVPGVNSAPSIRSPQWRGFLLEQLANALKLTKDQQAMVSPITGDLQRRLLDLHEKTTAQISKELNQEQRDKFKSLASLYDPPFYAPRVTAAQRSVPDGQLNISSPVRPT